MDRKKTILALIGIVIIFSILLFFIFNNRTKNSTKIKKMNATVLLKENNKVIVQDKNNIIYTFSIDDMKVSAGDKVVIKYTGILDKNRSLQDVEIIDYNTYNNKSSRTTNHKVEYDLSDKDIFSNFYNLAENKLKELTLNEKIGQLFLVRYPTSSAVADLKNYKFGGYLFFEKDFKDKTEDEVKYMINNLQDESNIPLLTAVDEEGGRVVRISSNNNLVNEKFKSSKDLYNSGGLNKIKEDTINKSKILYNLGINLNLAPVVDVSTNPSDYIYDRTIGENTSVTSKFAETVVNASKNTGVSYTLKHFPGYANNTDTHTGTSVDSRSYSDIVNNDLPPFEAGINSGAEAVLVSHNVVNSIDPSNPASLSASVHNLLRNDLNFTGIIMTDDLDMGALSSIDNPAVKAILSGNDMIISTNYSSDISQIKIAIENGVIDESLIDKLALRVLAWKYYKGIMFDNQK